MIPRSLNRASVLVVGLWLTTSATVNCYVTAPRGVLPIHRQKAYLELLTNDILNSDLGSLPPDQLKDTIPRLVDAWACHPAPSPVIGLLENDAETKENGGGNGLKNSTSRKPRKKAARRQSDAKSPTEYSSLQYSLTIEKLLKRLVDESYFAPELKETATSTEVYNALLTSWERAATERSGDVQVAVASAVRATTILIQMQELYEERGTTQPNELSFRTVLSAWEGAATLAASSSSSSSSAYSTPTLLYDVVSHLHSILDWMIDLYMDGKNVEVQNIVLERDVFHSVLSLMSKYTATKAVDRCERMLQRMEDLENYRHSQSVNTHLLPTSTVSPDTFTYNLVLQAWAKVGEAATDPTNREIVARRAYQILVHMEQLSHVEPNKRTYATAIHLLAKSGTNEHAMKARKIIKSLEQRFINSKGLRTDLLPDTMCYNTVINALAKSKDVHGIPHFAIEMFERMKAIYEEYNTDVCKPDIFSYSSLISAYAAVLGSKNMKRKAFTKAWNLWDDLKSNRQLANANHVTYGALLRSCTLLPSDSVERDEAVRKIFEECRMNGYVNSRIIDQLKISASGALYEEYMFSYAKNSKDIPLDWRRQLVQKHSS